MITTVKYFKFSENKVDISFLRKNKKYIYKVFGNLCKTEDDLYDHFKSELNFPDYFGRNWSALTDCLSDFCWLITDSVTILIFNSEFFLEKENEKIKLFWKIILSHVEISWKDVVFERQDQYATLNLVFITNTENEKLIDSLFKEYNIT